MGKPGHTGLKRIAYATRYSIAGLRAAWTQEAAFRQELALVLVGIPLAWWLGDGALERALLIGSLFLVLPVELLNSAVEAAIDRVGEDEHPFSARAKDLGSAAVLLTLALAALVWAIVLLG